jgi:hypothetical protein
VGVTISRSPDVEGNKTHNGRESLSGNNAGQWKPQDIEAMTAETCCHFTLTLPSPIKGEGCACDNYCDLGDRAPFTSRFGVLNSGPDT